MKYKRCIPDIATSKKTFAVISIENEVWYSGLCWIDSWNIEKFDHLHRFNDLLANNIIPLTLVSYI